MSGFVAANPDVAAWIIAAMATAIVALAGVVWRLGWRRFKEIESRLDRGDRCFDEQEATARRLALAAYVLCRALKPIAEDLECEELRAMVANELNHRVR